MIKTKYLLKKGFFTAFLFFLLASLTAQSSEKISPPTSHRIETMVGLESLFFQDNKTSKLVYRGYAPSYELGYRNIGKKWEWALQLSGNMSETSAINITYSEVRYNLNTTLLKKLSDRWLLGVRWNIGNLLYRGNNQLQNNAYYVSMLTNVSIATTYYAKIASKLLRLNLSLGVLGWFYESNSFSFSIPQSILEKGEYQYHDTISNNMLLKNFTFKPFWESLAVEIEIESNFYKRFVVAYRWRLNKYAIVKGYPVTFGSHFIGLKYYLLNRKKK